MHRKWVSFFLLFNISIIAILELNYRYNRKGFIRHALDQRMNIGLPDSRNRSIDTIMFSTSVTYGSIRKFAINGNVLDLTTTYGVGFLGQYLMLKRYLAHNTVKNVYLFALPKSFVQDIYNMNGAKNDPLFDHGYEKRILGLVRKHPYRPDYFASRINYLKFWNSTYRRLDRNRLVLDRKGISLDPYSGGLAGEKRDRERVRIPGKLDFIFKKLVRLCRENGIKLFLVMEPLSRKNYRDYKNTDLAEYIRSHGIGLVEFNTIHTFGDADFFDGIHLRDNKKKLYSYLVDNHVVRFLAGQASTANDVGSNWSGAR